MEKVDVIIPVYKPDRGFLTMVEKLQAQTVPVNRIILINTEQKYLDRLFYGTTLEREHHNITVKHLSKREFDHGRTRNQGVKLSDAEVFVMMTQDAIPADEFLVERLLEGLRGERRQSLMPDSFRERTAARPSGIRDSLIIRKSPALRQRPIFRSLASKLFFVPMCVRHTKEIFLMNLVAL